MNLRYLNGSQLAEITGYDRRTVKDRLAKLKPYKQEGKAILYDARKALAVLYGQEDPEKKTIYNQIQEQTLRTESARAEKLELENAQKKGELVPVIDVCKAVEKEYVYVRTTLVSLPTKLAKPLSLENDPAIVQSLLTDAINETLTHLQADITLAEAEKPAEKLEQTKPNEE